MFVIPFWRIALNNRCLEISCLRSPNENPSGTPKYLSAFSSKITNGVMIVEKSIQPEGKNI